MNLDDLAYLRAQGVDIDDNNYLDTENTGGGEKFQV